MGLCDAIKSRARSVSSVCGYWFRQFFFKATGQKECVFKLIVKKDGQCHLRRKQFLNC